MAFIDKDSLIHICHAGQFKQDATVIPATLRVHDETGDVLVILANRKGEKIGTCRADDIPGAIEAFQAAIEPCHGSGNAPNANIDALTRIFAHAEAFTKKVEIALRAERKAAVRDTLTVYENRPQ